MKPIVVQAKQTSQPHYVPRGARVTLSGSGYVEWTPAATLQDAFQTSAQWDTWPLGTSEGSQDAVRGMGIRVVGTGECTVTIEEGVSDREPDTQYWDSQGMILKQVTAAELAALTTGQPSVTYEVTDLPGRPRYRWDGSAFAAVVTAQTDPVTGGIKHLMSDGATLGRVGGQLFCIAGRNTATSFSDLTSNAATLTPDSGNTGAFATADYIASIAATNGGLTIPATKLVWNPRRQSLIMGFVLKKAAPGANESILGVGGGVGAAQTGFYVSHRTSGALKIVPCVAGSIVNAQADSTLSFSDAAPRDRHCCIAYDATTGVWYIYRDGVLSNAFTGTPMTGANAFPDANVTHEYRVGGVAGGATVVTVATLTYGHQAIVFGGALPLAVGRIAARLAEAPRLPLTLMDVA